MVKNLSAQIAALEQKLRDLKARKAESAQPQRTTKQAAQLPAAATGLTRASSLTQATKDEIVRKYNDALRTGEARKALSREYHVEEPTIIALTAIASRQQPESEQPRRRRQGSTAGRRSGIPEPQLPDRRVNGRDLSLRQKEQVARRYVELTKDGMPTQSARQVVADQFGITNPQSVIAILASQRRLRRARAKK